MEGIPFSVTVSLPFILSGSGSSGTVNTTAMNDFSVSGTGSYSNGRTSAYGNDNSNIQFVDVDGGATITSLISNGGMWRYYSLNNYAAVPSNVSGLNWGPRMLTMTLPTAPIPQTTVVRLVIMSPA